MFVVEGDCASVQILTVPYFALLGPFILALHEGCLVPSARHAKQYSHGKPHTCYLTRYEGNYIVATLYDISNYNLALM